jgi:SAM-dependent methyltransferase
MKNFKEFLLQRKTASGFNIRLRCFADEYLNYKRVHQNPIRILDVGCGHNCELFNYKQKEDKYYACDFYEVINAQVDDYKVINFNEEKLTNRYGGEKFDIIFCGEVIEHLFSPDSLLSEMMDLMNEESILILSTPNLGYYVNRFLLLFGINPLFLENSSEVKLGRKFKFLGQFNKTEGHIRVFTYGALRDLLELKGFKIVKIISVPVWENVVDRIVCFFSRSLSADNIFILKK